METIKQKKDADLGNAPIGRLLLNLALPAIVAQVINVLYNMVDRMYIGHIDQVGPDALTGVGVTMPIIMCISAFAALVSMGGAPQASILMGKGKPEEAEKILGNCTSMLLMIALALTVLFLGFGRPILLMFGASEQTIPYAWAYMQIYVCGTVFVQMAPGTQCLYQCPGVCQDRHDDCRHRCSLQYHSGSSFHLWPPYGCPRRSAGHRYLPGRFLYLDSPFSYRQKNALKNTAAKS